METKILDAGQVHIAALALREGRPVVFPTETVYGLGAPVFNEEAVRQIFSIKGRPSDNPLIAHIDQIEGAERLSDGLEEKFYRLAEAFWPGPLTLVVKKRAEVPSIVSAGQPTVGIRLPSHPVARRLIEAVGQPLVAPSANLSGRPSPTRSEDVLEDLSGKVEYVVEGGCCEVGIESTVLSLYGERPTLLRPGRIRREEIEEVLGEKVALPVKGGPILSPGMKYRHYAPNTPVRLVYRLEELERPFLLPTAQNLYAELREADRLGASVIEIYCDAAVQADEALMNRLLRAAGQIE